MREAFYRPEWPIDKLYYLPGGQIFRRPVQEVPALHSASGLDKPTLFKLAQYHLQKPRGDRLGLGNLLAQLGKDLAEQIHSCMCRCTNHDDTEHWNKKAATIARDFLARIPELRTALALDAQAFYDGDPAAKSVDEVIYCYPGFYAVTVYRIAHELLELGVTLMPRIMTEHAHTITGTDIHPGASIGKRFFVDHATGVVIGETTQIGDNVKVYQGVTLGAKSFPKDQRGRVIKGFKRHPTIQDDVTIYPNATILGGKTVVGKGATIGGNVYIIESVPANTVVKQEDPKLLVLPKKRKKAKRTQRT